MNRVSDILYLLLSLGVRLLDRMDAEKSARFRAAVLADPAGEWVHLMGGTDRRNGAGGATGDTGSGSHE